MKESPPKVITIPAKPEVARRQAIQRQLRVAAYKWCEQAKEKRRRRLLCFSLACF